MANLAAQLARKYAAEALALEPEEVPAAESPPEPEPQSAPAPAPAPARNAPPRIAGIRIRTPSCKPMHPAMLFTHMVATVRACVALIARLAATLTAPASQARRPDPRHAPLTEIFRHIVERRTDRTQILGEINTRLVANLAADPARERTVVEIVEPILDDLAIQIDWARLPDKYLHILNGQTPIGDPPTPRATSPP